MLMTVMVKRWQFDLCGGHLAVDFANTVSSRLQAPVERLPAYDDLVELLRQTKTISESEARRRRALAAKDPRRAAKVHARAIALRDALYDIFHAAAEEKEPAAADMALLNGAARQLELGAGFAWTWVERDGGLDAPLGPIVIAALELLVHGPRARLRLCELESCGWLFLDTSKNRSRRWCDMKICGNRAKARRHYARQHG
jgi:predicted RNA-binding Zn ribbon-like protein